MFGVDCASGDTFVTNTSENLSLESMFVPEPVVSMSIQPNDNKSRDNLQKAVARFTKEDPTFRYHYDLDSKESIVSGMGELHLEIYAQRMEREYNCLVTLGKPKVAFRETLMATCNFDYLHKKQSGGHGQFGRVIGYMEPMGREENTIVDFRDETQGTNVPKPMVVGVKKGFLEMCEKGPLSGNKLAGVRFVLQDGANHKVDSSEFSFFCAAQGAVRDVFADGNFQILEPIMSVEIDIPTEFRGAVISELSKREGILTGSDGGNDGWVTLYVEVPLNNMFGYSGHLRYMPAFRSLCSLILTIYLPFVDP